MWVYEEEIEFPPPAPPSSGASGNGTAKGVVVGGSSSSGSAPRGRKTRKLSEVINEQNENVKYLPGVKLGPNVRAEPDLAASVKGADVLLLCVPHQHAGRVVRGLVGAVDAENGPGGGSRKTVALSLIKGIRVRPEGPQLISAMVERVLGIETAVLMGANIAEEVARGGLTEATVAAASPATAELFVRLFSTDNFVVRACSDRVGVEMAGTLKNVVALAVGIATVRYRDRESVFWRLFPPPSSEAAAERRSFSLLLLLLTLPPFSMKQKNSRNDTRASAPARTPRLPCCGPAWARCATSRAASQTPTEAPRAAPRARRSGPIPSSKRRASRTSSPRATEAATPASPASTPCA